jgi:hypothetical protein
MFITGVNDTGKKLINPCHGFSVIAGVVDIGDKFVTGDPVTPVTNFHR